MHFNTLQQVRQQIYGCFERSADALFNLSDALLSEPQARSLPELSLSVFFQRRFLKMGNVAHNFLHLLAYPLDNTSESY